MAKVRKKIRKEKLDKRWLDDVPEDKVFWCHDGRTVRNMDELAVVLAEMSEDTFCYHANGGKNDFSNWIRDVIGDVKLARELAMVVTKPNAVRKVEMRLRSIGASP